MTLDEMLDKLKLMKDLHGGDCIIFDVNGYEAVDIDMYDYAKYLDKHGDNITKIIHDDAQLEYIEDKYTIIEKGTAIRVY